MHLVAGTARFVESDKAGGKIKLAVLLTNPDGDLKGFYKHRCAHSSRSCMHATP